MPYMDPMGLLRLRNFVLICMMGIMQDDSEDFVSQTTLIHIFDTAENQHGNPKNGGKMWKPPRLGQHHVQVPMEKNAWGGVTSTAFFCAQFQGAAVSFKDFYGPD